MCDDKAHGGRRCPDYDRLSGLAAFQIAPELREGVPDVAWVNEDLKAGLWDKAGDGEDHKAAGAAVARLLEVRRVEPEVTGAVLEALPEGCRAHGLAHRVKSPGSMADKIKRKRRRGRSGWEDPARTVARFTDVLRYTVVAPDHDRLVEVAEETLGGLRERGWEVIEATDFYGDGAPYQGLHFLVRTAAEDERDVTVFELQVHSEASQAVKDDIHGFYEVYRSDDPAVSKRERADAREECVRRSAVLRTPAGLAELSELAGARLTTPTCEEYTPKCEERR